MEIGDKMRVALEEARLALAEGEVPVGAAVFDGDELVCRAHNRCEALRDPTAHAEVLAIRAAAQKRGDWRLNGCTLYVTLQPCAMCLGAIEHARVSRVVFGAFDTQDRPVGVMEMTGGLLEVECGELLADFFARRRDGERQGAGDAPQPSGPLVAPPVSDEPVMAPAFLDEDPNHQEESMDQQDYQTQPFTPTQGIEQPRSAAQGAFQAPQATFAPQGSQPPQATFAPQGSQPGGFAPPPRQTTAASAGTFQTPPRHSENQVQGGFAPPFVGADAGSQPAQATQAAQPQQPAQANRFCSQCGTPVREGGARFCEKCGSRLDGIKQPELI